MNPTNRSTLNPATSSFIPSGHTVGNSSSAFTVQGSLPAGDAYTPHTYRPGSRVCQTTHQDGNTVLWEWGTGPYFAKIALEDQYDVDAGEVQGTDDTNNDDQGIDVSTLISMPIDVIYKNLKRDFNEPIQMKDLHPQSRKFIKGITSFKRGLVSEDGNFREFNDIRSVELKTSPDIWDKESYDQAENNWHRITNNLDRIEIGNSNTAYNKWDDTKSKDLLSNWHKHVDRAHELESYRTEMEAGSSDRTEMEAGLLGYMGSSNVWVTPTARACQIFGNRSGNPPSVPYRDPSQRQS